MLLLKGIAIAALQNSNNEFILPSGKSISTAAAGELPADTRAMITNSPAKELILSVALLGYLYTKNKRIQNEL